MKDLIKALQIFIKYGQGEHAPFYCGHDTLYVCDGIEVDAVSTIDLKELESLGFIAGDDNNFISFRFGSC